MRPQYNEILWKKGFSSRLWFVVLTLLWNFCAVAESFVSFFPGMITSPFTRSILQQRSVSIASVRPAPARRNARRIMSVSASNKRHFPNDVKSLARFILSDECQSIGVLTGAGISVASGIPDFRSPGGMYDTLRPELITASPMERRLMEQDPTYVVSWDIFQHNPFPYLEVRRPFILGTQQHQWKATLGHWFFDLLAQKQPHKLKRLYTQNIDGLFYQLPHVPPEIIVNVHGSIATVSCEVCNHHMPLDDFCEQVRSKIKDIYQVDPNAPTESEHIPCPQCQRPTVKPSTVLFGRNLPESFWECSEKDMPQTDLLIVAGTSLMVSPANSLVYRVPDTCARVLINREPAGQELGLKFSSKEDYPEEGTSNRDLFLPGDCDGIFFELIQELGWLEDCRAIKDKLPPQSAALLQDEDDGRE